MEVAVDNVPSFDGQIYVAIDTSGSMKSPVTGHRYGSSSSVRCIDAASLFAAAILRKNRNAVLIPFDVKVHDARSLNGRDSVMTNADKLAKYGGGGTNSSCVLEFLNAQQAKGDAVIYISDNESWIDSGRHYYGEEQGVRMQYEWERFRQRNKAAKLVCIDLTPEPTSQVQERPNVLQIGGFSDTVFDIVQSFLKYGIEVNHWVSEIEKINLDVDAE
jgi:60 kDa SS-A/Ro ribonucleoprotein